MTDMDQWTKRCYARHDGVWQPSPVVVPGAVWARRFSLPLPPPPPPPPPAPPPAPPAPPTLQPWSAAGRPSTPGSFRGLYFATHFGNFFANAPPARVTEYLEDMALWYDQLVCRLPRVAWWCGMAWRGGGPSLRGAFFCAMRCAIADADTG